jgi:hypothetical protein
VAGALAAAPNAVLTFEVILQHIPFLVTKPLLELKHRYRELIIPS